MIFAVVGAGVGSGSGLQTKWRVNTSYQSGDMPKITWQLGFSHAYDTRKQPDEWCAIANKDLVCRGAELNLSPRPISRSRIGDNIPTRLVAQGLLPQGDDIPPDPSIAMQHDSMAMREFGLLFGPKAERYLPSKDGLPLNNLAAQDGNFYLIVDLGRQSVGFVTLRLSTDDNLVIDIGHGEHLNDLRVRSLIGDRNFATRFNCGPGSHDFTHWYRRIGGRYLQLNIRGAKTSFKLHYAGIKPVLYPVNQEGLFTSANRRLDDIFQVSARTLHLCMHEHYEDTPWREQALYANDGRNQALAGYYAFGEEEFPAASFELLGKGVGDDGWIEMCMPAVIDHTIPSFTFCWILAVADHWMHCGDREFVERTLPVIERILNRRTSEMNGGLLPCPAGQRYWQFYDWVPGLSGEGRILAGELRFDSLLNLFFLLALEAGIELSRYFDLEDSAKNWLVTAAELRKKIDTAFWVEDRGAYQSFIGDKAQPHFCEHAQALALLANVPPDHLAAYALRANLHGVKDMVATSLSQSLYKYTALLQGDDVDQTHALDSIEKDWGAMLRTGATSFWETHSGSDDFGGAGSMCHGWSGIPAYIFGAYVLGVRPVEPGFKEFIVDPIVSDIAFAEGHVPTPWGTIEIKVSQTAEGTQVDLHYPEQLQCKPNA